MLVAIYHMLKHGTAYRDMTPEHFDRRDKTRIANRLKKRLEVLGYAVQIAPAA